MGIPLIGNIIDGVSGFFQKREERKQAVETAKLKIREAKDKADNDLELTDAEWESIAVSQQDSSWKDEYLTLIITLPIPMIMVGAVYLVFTGDDRLMVGVNKALVELQSLGMDWGELMYTVVLAGVGLKVWRAK